jgi:hypothetical protein
MTPDLDLSQLLSEEEDPEKPWTLRLLFPEFKTSKNVWNIIGLYYGVFC